MKICGCGHDLDKHPDRGPCVVCARSATPDKCPGYHSRRSSGRRVFPVPSENGPLLHQTPLERIARSLERIAAALERGAPVVGAPLNGTPTPARARLVAIRQNPVVVEPVAPARTANGSWQPNLCERALLQALARRAPKSSTRAQVAIISGYSVNSGSFANALSVLRKQGLIEGSGEIRLTADGQRLAPPSAPANGKALYELWSTKLGRCERAILDVLVLEPDRGPYTRDVLAARAGYSAGSGGYANALSRLRTLELINGRGDDIRANQELFS